MALLCCIFVLSFIIYTGTLPLNLVVLCNSDKVVFFAKVRQTPTLGEDWGLPRELLQHLGSSGQSVSALSHADVQAELANADLSHGVLLLLTLVLKWNNTKI